MFSNINFDDFIEDLKTELQNELPGFDAQKTMSPSIREDLMGNTAPNSNTRQSAVLILLFPNGNSIDTLLIKRPVYDGPHSGQVSFPGGKFDEADSDIQATALRETFEEVGVSPSDISIIGQLTQLYIPVSNMMVHPFVGVIDFKPLFKPDVKEVERIISAPINQLVNPKNRSIKVIPSHQKLITAPYFNISKEFVWGATAMILAEFVEIINGSIKKRQ